MTVDVINYIWNEIGNETNIDIKPLKKFMIVYGQGLLLDLKIIPI